MAKGKQQSDTNFRNYCKTYTHPDMTSMHINWSGLLASTLSIEWLQNRVYRKYNKLMWKNVKAFHNLFFFCLLLNPVLY